MRTTNPYLRSAITGAIWFAFLIFRTVNSDSDEWRSHPWTFFLPLIVALMGSIAITGFVAGRFRPFRSWWAIGFANVTGLLLALYLMLAIVEQIYPTPATPKFKNTEDKMAYLAAQTVQWVKRDKGVNLDYSFDSIRIVEQQLGQISKDVNKDKPQEGTFGLALGYGAYIGEVFRRRSGGSWAQDDMSAGKNSFPLSLTNGVIYPVGWCWKRLINGEEDDVYRKAILFSDDSADIRKRIQQNTESRKAR